MEHSLKTGLCFGLTSATITTLGLMVGLESGTGSKLVVLGGILTIAIADAFSDALGIHVSEESENKHTPKEIWLATIATWCAKFFFALTFIVPVLFLPLSIAVIASIIWGLLALATLSYITGREDGHPWKAVFEHLFIALVVIVITHYVGDAIAAFFG